MRSEQQAVRQAVLDHRPCDLALAGQLWTRAGVGDLIAKLYRAIDHAGPRSLWPAAVSDEVHDAAEALAGEVLRFRDPEPAAVTEDFTNTVRGLSDVFGGLHTPLDGPLRYFEVPPEWKRTDPAHCYLVLGENSQAAKSVLDAYRYWVNKLDEKALLV